MYHFDKKCFSDTSREGGPTEQRDWKFTLLPNVSVTTEISRNQQEHEATVFRSWVLGVDFYSPGIAISLSP